MISMLLSSIFFHMSNIIYKGKGKYIQDLLDLYSMRIYTDLKRSNSRYWSICGSIDHNFPLCVSFETECRSVWVPIDYRSNRSCTLWWLIAAYFAQFGYTCILFCKWWLNMIQVHVTIVRRIWPVKRGTCIIYFSSTFTFSQF